MQGVIKSTSIKKWLSQLLLDNHLIVNILQAYFGKLNASVISCITAAPENEGCEHLARVMKAKGVSAYRVAKDLDITQSTLSDWKSGRSMPKTDKLSKIAEYFGVTIEYFVT